MGSKKVRVELEIPLSEYRVMMRAAEEACVDQRDPASVVIALALATARAVLQAAKGGGR